RTVRMAARCGRGCPGWPWISATGPAYGGGAGGTAPGRGGGRPPAAAGGGSARRLLRRLVDELEPVEPVPRQGDEVGQLPDGREGHPAHPLDRDLAGQLARESGFEGGLQAWEVQRTGTRS